MRRPPISGPCCAIASAILLLGGAGASAADPVVGSARATAVPPIARWDVVPFQRIQGSEPFRMGVVAFSQQGIAKVEFRISGQGYRGGVKEAGEMARNPRTGVWEYWVPLEAREFSADGPIEVEAVVHGKDGGRRSKDMDNDGVPDGLGLDPLVLNVNPGGTLPRREAWVSLSGSDETGEAGDRRRPFATIRGAALGLADSSRSIDGCVVYLEEGDHTWNGDWVQDPGYRTAHEWFTVTCAAGAARERTRIVGSDKPFNNLLTRVAGLTLANPTLRGGSGVLSRSNRIAPGLVWTDRNHHQGSGRYSGHDPSRPYDYGHDLFFSNAPKRQTIP